MIEGLENMQRALQQMEVARAHLENWVCGHSDVLIKLERRGLLEAIWQIDDGIACALDRLNRIADSIENK